MADQLQNGKTATPQIPEGTMYLFVVFNPKTGEYACTFSSLTDALALHSMAETSLNNEKQRAFSPVPNFTAPAMGGFDPALIGKIRGGRG
jgi:hypothetical protein